MTRPFAPPSGARDVLAFRSMRAAVRAACLLVLSRAGLATAAGAPSATDQPPPACVGPARVLKDILVMGPGDASGPMSAPYRIREALTPGCKAAVAEGRWPGLTRTLVSFAAHDDAIKNEICEIAPPEALPWIAEWEPHLDHPAYEATCAAALLRGSRADFDHIVAPRLIEAGVLRPGLVARASVAPRGARRLVAGVASRRRRAHQRSRRPLQRRLRGRTGPLRGALPGRSAPPGGMGEVRTNATRPARDRVAARPRGGLRIDLLSALVPSPSRLAGHDDEHPRNRRDIGGNLLDRLHHAVAGRGRSQCVGRRGGNDRGAVRGVGGRIGRLDRRSILENSTTSVVSRQRDPLRLRDGPARLSPSGMTDRRND